MTIIYDNWERLVRATLRREHLRQSSQRTPSDLSEASSSSSFSFTSLPSRLLSFNFLSLGNSFTYYQILRATGLLSNSNLIKQGHSGDLYYGVLDGGVQAVIKKIDLSSVKTESCRYISELEILHEVSHSRLVPLLGHCLENMNEKFLIYEYMPKKDLSSHLYRKIVQDDSDRLEYSSLDWKTRLKIGIGAAEGLCYLHHQCFPPIVHGDLQASSILLDDNFEVRVGSLSEACTALEKVANENWITRLLGLPKQAGQGTFGTASTTTATCAYDVHCFGKVLLQLVTGKLRLPPAIGFSDPFPPPMGQGQPKNWKDLTLRIYDRELVREILDPSLIIHEHVFLEVWAVAIVARACLDPKPSRRPQMAQVLKALKDGRITEGAYFEMTRTLASYKSFLGPISPKFYT